MPTNKTYNLAGNYYYTPNFRRKTKLSFDLAQKNLWKPIDPLDLKKNSLDIYISKWAKKL